MKSMQTTATRQAVTWGRFSSDQQKDGDSKDRQERMNPECAKRLGINVIGEYFDESTSVKDGVTPLFKKVIADLPSGVGIICENLDRINRTHPWKQKAYIYELVENGHFIITSQDGTEYNQETINQVGTVATGDLQTNLANAENVKRTKRVKEAKANAVELARQGKPAPFGKWLPAHIKYNPETMQYDIRQDRKAVIKKIFTDYANGKGVCLITGDLNLAGTPTFRGKGKIGGWQRTTIFTLLRYEGLIGVFNYKNERIINAWPAAIPEDLFYKVQSILEVNKTKHGNHKSTNVNNILRGVAKCSHCGSTMKVTTDGYLACYGYQIKRCKVGNMISGYKNIEYEFAKWFVPTAKDALLGKTDNTYGIDSLMAKKTVLNGKMEAMVSLLDNKAAAIAAQSRLDKLGIELNTVENEIATFKATQANNAMLPETFIELDRIIDGIRDNQEIRKKVANLVPTIVKRVDIDIKDKIYPTFTVHLINGEQTITFAQEYSLTNVESGVTVTLAKDRITSSDGKLNIKRK